MLEADGGTRTASITGGFVALALALAKVKAVGVLREPVAAISVGFVEGLGHALDLCYVEDSRARVDLNVVATASGKIVEVQGTAEGEPIERARARRAWSTWPSPGIADAGPAAARGARVARG